MRSDSVNIVLVSYASKQTTYIAKKVKYAYANLHSKILIEDEMCELVNYGAQNLLWKDYCLSVTCMSQTKIRSEFIWDACLCDLIKNKTYGPIQYGTNKRWLIICLLDNKDRVGKVTLQVIKLYSMYHYRNWILYGSG